MNKNIIKLSFVVFALCFTGAIAMKDENLMGQPEEAQRPRRIVCIHVRQFLRLRPGLRRQLQQLILQRAQTQIDQVPPISDLLQDLANNQMLLQQQIQNQQSLPSFGELMHMIGYDQPQEQEQLQDQDVQQEQEVLPSFDELLDSIGENSPTDQN